MVIPIFMKKPSDAVIAVTYRCNSRCIMCNIWQIKSFPEMPAEAYLKLPKSLRFINISGGEPFLRTDLVDIIKTIKKACPKAGLNISTNGFLVDTIKRVLPKILEIDSNISVSVSIDGVGKMHEQVRRVDHAWEKVLETARFCRDEAGVKHIKFAFTLNNENYKQLKEAYEWSRRLGLEFAMAIAHSSDVYFGKNNSLRFSKVHLDRGFAFVISDLLKSMRPKDWARAYFVDGLYKVARGEKRPLKSFAGEDFFYLDPKGDVYPSVVDNVIMGNINDVDKFKTLWKSEQARQAREMLAGFESNYWMMCTARTAFVRNPIKVANWIFKNKFFS